MRIIKQTLFIFLSPILILGFLSAISKAQVVDKDKLKKDISDFVDVADKNFETSHNRFERLSKRDGDEIKEIFLFSLKDNKIERLTLEFVSLKYPEAPELFRFKEAETYYFKNGKLLFATESISSSSRDEPDWEDRWAVYFDIHNGKIIDTSSVGHGKTESDDWEPEPVKLAKERLKQLGKKINKIKF